MKSAIQPIIIYKFYTENCQPCRAIEPHLARLQTEYNTKTEMVKVVSIDANESELSNYFNIQSVPTLVFIGAGTRRGEILGRLVGLQSYEAIQAATSKALVSRRESND